MKTMKIKFKSERQMPFRKQGSKWALIVLVAASCVAVANSAWAQAVTGTPYLSNVNPSIFYASWASSPPTVISSTPTGLEASSIGYGSLHYDIPVGDQQLLNSGDVYATLTLTINNPSSDPGTTYWIGVPFLLDDNQGGADISYGGYAGMFGYTGTGTAVWTGNTLTESVPLYGATLSAAESGTGVITGFNLQLDPAVVPGGAYDVTFNSLVLSVPEPGSLMLIGLGVTSFLVFRRRK
jgi:PEP-CTERM motif